MFIKTLNPAQRGASAGLGKITCLAAGDVFDHTVDFPRIQAFFVARRYGVPPCRARLIAALAFDGRRA